MFTLLPVLLPGVPRAAGGDETVGHGVSSQGVSVVWPRLYRREREERRFFYLSYPLRALCSLR